MKIAPSALTAFTAISSAAALTLMLSACGGGDDTVDTSTANEAAADSASATETPEAATLAVDTTVSTSQAVVAAGTSGQVINCAGGGTAQYTVTGGADDGVITAGETYQLQFTQCVGASSLAALNGQATLAVTAWSPSQIGVQLTYTNLAAALPNRTATLNGTTTATSTQVYTTATGWPTSTTTLTWQTSGLTLARQTTARTTTYTLTSNLTHTTQRTAGTVTGTTLTGSSTLQAQWPNGQWQSSLDASGGITFDTAGVPTGRWLVTLSARAMDITATTGQVVVAVDLGKDGNVDRTWTFTPGNWSAQVQ